ncbi:hypothetical protein DL95DRAFT_390438 [Leptodontidium sp. 2 PMI_412]|nr:hypothetical protein DL95DRAFT_390438 [Leptodontidium sp. 2 PMI_412]
MEALASPAPSSSPCPWIPCSASSAIRAESETAAHLREHWEERRRQWPALRNCGWQNCQSRATFKSPGSLKSHIFNIHVTPLVCTHPQCTYAKPFGKQYELDRHINTIHLASHNHQCPVQSCEAHTTGFARKDKLLNHIREQHDNLRCPYNHCFATVLETQVESHLRLFHGSFECALGACSASGASCFLEEDLQRHLRKHHNLTYDPSLSVTKASRHTEDNTARPSHVITCRTWQDCPVCSTAQSASSTMQDKGGN